MTLDEARESRGDLRCGTCRWHVEGEVPGAASEIGACHRFPPVVVKVHSKAAQHWPMTHRTQFCGEYEPMRMPPKERT